jgi:hypothetical protein
LNALRPSINDYAGEERDTVADMDLTEGALAGIASRIGKEKRVRLPANYVQLLKRQLIDGPAWIRRDGTRHNLEKNGDLMDFALVLDEMRQVLLAKVAVRKRITSK